MKKRVGIPSIPRFLLHTSLFQQVRQKFLHFDTELDYQVCVISYNPQVLFTFLLNYER